PPVEHIGSDSSIEFKPIIPEIVRDIIPPLELDAPEEMQPPPLPPAPLPPPRTTEDDVDYFLPRDYEITDDWPAAPSQAPPRRPAAPQGALIQQRDSTAIQSAPAAANQEALSQGYEQATTSDRPSTRPRSRYVDDGDDRPRRPPREDMRGKWPIVL